MARRRADTPPDAIQFAREQRRKATMPERILWNLLRNRRLNGLKFRRQVPIGPYTADFYCAEATLIVELDGSTHRDRRKLKDRIRDQSMRDHDLFTLRVTAGDLTRSRDSVRRTIAATAEALLAEEVRKEGKKRSPSPPRQASAPLPAEPGRGRIQPPTTTRGRPRPSPPPHP